MGRKITREEFINRINEASNGTIAVIDEIYEGTQAEYTFKCLACGYEWKTKGYSVLQGHGCRKCYDRRNSESKLFPLNEVQKRVNESGSDTEIIGGYVDTKHKCDAKCRKCGHIWRPNVSEIMRGHGCPRCGVEKISKQTRMDEDEFKQRCIGVHGNEYDLSEINYRGVREKINPICRKHGKFEITVNSFLNGSGCKKCKEEDILLKNKNEFIKKATKRHKGKYDYSLINYIGNDNEVEIICSEHGIFRQSPRKHLMGHGCIECGKRKSINKRRKYTTDFFISEARKIHGDKYDYHETEYIKYKKEVKIICPKHGEFWQTPHEHLAGCGCQKCSRQLSKAEDDIMSLLERVHPQQRNRDILNGKEIDIYIPSLKLGIEYNGLVWHSERFGKDKHYHIGKLKESNKQGIRLIQIFEDEWIIHREICESKLKHICGLEQDKPKVFARKCQIREIKNKEAEEFLNRNHIQGFVGATVYLGCFYNEDLIGVMSFKCEKEGYWDLNRFATDIRFNCIGVGGKLFKYFTKYYDYQEIKSFADRRWTINPIDNLYTKLGFEFVEFTRPDYRYYGHSKEIRYHKFGFRKQILHKKYGLPLSMTEYEMTKELGYYRIWDCGLIKFLYKKKK